MNRTLGVLRMHVRDKATWLYIPWIILLSSFVVNIVISYFVPEPIYSGGLASIFIFTSIMGALTLANTFPFAIGFSVRRQDYFVGTVIMASLVNAVTAILLLLLSMIENRVTGGWGSNLHFFHLPYLNDGSIAVQFMIYFAALLNLYFAGFVISSVHRRFGKAGLYIFSIVVLFVLSLGSFIVSHNRWWDDIFIWLAHHSVFELAMWTVPATAVYALVSYLLLRRATV